jgi:aspartate kinase
VSKVSIVGAGMRTRTGVAQRMFAALADEGINVRMITTGDIKISVLVDRPDSTRALRAIHKSFRLDEPRAGAGRPAPDGNGSPLTARPIDRAADARELTARIARLSAMEDIIVSGVELNADHGRITVAGLPDRAGNCSAVFEAVARGGIVVDMIVQNLTDAGRAELSFTVPRTDLDRAAGLARDAAKLIDAAARVTADGDIVVLFVYGVGMRTHTGVARKMFGALAARDINIAMINTSEVCVSVVVERRHGAAALAGLRGAFEIE